MPGDSGAGLAEQRGNSSNQTQRNPGCFVGLGEWLVKNEKYLEKGRLNWSSNLNISKSSNLVLMLFLFTASLGHKVEMKQFFLSICYYQVWLACLGTVTCNTEEIAHIFEIIPVECKVYLNFAKAMSNVSFFFLFGDSDFPMGQENKQIIFPLSGIIRSHVNLQEVCLILLFLSPFKLLIPTCPW